VAFDCRVTGSGLELTLLEGDQPTLLAALRRGEIDVTPSRDYFLSLFQACGLEPQVGFRTGSLEMVRGLVGHGLGYSLLATKPANNMSYDGRSLAARPLSTVVESSRLVLATRADRALTEVAEEFAAHCRAFFHGALHAHSNS
jgi:DNA-binding transcriptional LysR family regulator